MSKDTVLYGLSCGKSMGNIQHRMGSKPFFDEVFEGPGRPGTRKWHR
jgi:hypothetical protein